MYTFQQKAEVTQISLTGARLIVILGALMLEPRSIDELNALVTDCGLVDKNYSKDTIRIALSTLKAIGCEITRPCKSSEFKYKLLSHPFALKISDLEIQALKTLYNNIVNGSDLKKALNFKSFLDKLAKHICNDSVHATLNNFTAFKKVEQPVYEALIAQDGKHNTLEITYSNPSNNKPSKKTFIFGSMFLKTNKLYVEGIDVNSNKNIVFNASRIVSVDSVTESRSPYQNKAFKVKYKLTNPELHTLDESQKVLKAKKGEILVETEFKNNFFALQHVLSLGPDCTVVEPESLKDDVVKKLTELRRIYE